MICSILCKTLIGIRSLRTRFDKLDEIIRVYNGTRYLLLFAHEKVIERYNKCFFFMITQKAKLTHMIV